MVVVDASVVMRWFVRDQWTEAALDIAAGEELIAPALLRVEVANALRNQVRFSDMDLAQALANLKGLSKAVVAFDDEPLLADALRLAADRDHAIYDCLYVALAQREQVALVTADGKLSRKFADLPGLSLVNLLTT